MDDIKKLLMQLLEGHEELKLRMDKLENKLETKIEMLSERIDNHEREIKKLNIVK